MSYIITTLCYGYKYQPIQSHWLKRIEYKCSPDKTIVIDENEINCIYIPSYEYAWWDIVRLNKNISVCQTENKPVVHIDMDIIVEKDIQPLVDLPYDFIISTEIGGNQSFPKECSQILGFGICSGFYVIKPGSIPFMLKTLENMKNKAYGSLSDQVNIMNYIVNNYCEIKEETVVLNQTTYTNNIITIDDIQICVLDFKLVTRDPIVQSGQFGNHINIDNVGGVESFIRYFYEPLENLPLTCRCGKTHLGDYNECIHKRL